MESEKHYETLDPEDWGEMRDLAHRMIDDAITYLETIGTRPVWQPVPEDVAKQFDSSAPHEPAGADAVYQEFLENVFPYPMGNIHPRFWAWYMTHPCIQEHITEYSKDIDYMQQQQQQTNKYQPI